MQRRTFLKLGLAAGGAALLGGSAVLLWSAEERAVLHKACLVLFPEASLDGAVEGVLRYRERLPFEVQLQLQGLLRGLETMPLPTHGGRFTQLGDDARADFLQGLAHSDLYPRRLLFHGLKQTCAMGLYSRPANWEQILGYEGPLVQR